MIGIALGVAVLVAVIAVNQSILASVASTIDDIAGKADLRVSAGSSGLDESLIEAIRTTPGVFKATLVIEQTAKIVDRRAGNERLLVLGIDFLNADDEYFRSYGSAELTSIEHDPIAFLNSPYHLILGRAVADRFGYKLHDRVALQTPSGVQAFEIWGFANDEGVGHAFGGSVAVMDYAAMQLAFDRGRNVDGIDVAVAPGVDVTAVASAIAKVVGSAFSVERPERKNDRVSRMLGSLQSGLSMASLIAVLVGMFLVHNTTSISVVQRRREIGILRALGAKRSDVLSLFVFEGALVGAVGSAFGVLIGIFLARALLHEMGRTVSALFLPVAADKLEIRGALLASAWTLGVLVSTIGAAIPARDAARARPIEALQRGASSPPEEFRRTRFSAADGFALVLLAVSVSLLRVPPVHGMPLGATAACVALMISGALFAPRFVRVVHELARRVLDRVGNVEARLANENLCRDLRRTASTSSALMVGVAMATCFAAFVGSFVSSTVEWVEQMLPADLWITSGSRMSGGGDGLAMSQELLPPLTTLPDVESVERVRMPDIVYDGVPIKLIATDLPAAHSTAHWIMLEGTQEDAMARMRRGAIAVAENFSRHFGVHRGDRIALAVNNGTRSFDVAAVIVDYTSDTGVVLVDYATYAKEWADERVDTYKLFLRPGAEAEVSRREINRRFGSRYDLFVLTNHEFRDEILRMLDQAFAVMRMLELVAIVIAVLAVVNTLLANVLDRIREIALLRAIGMLRRQIRTMIVVEGFLVGIAGVFAGVLLGLALGHVLLRYINLVQTGWYLPYRPSWLGVAETALLVIVGSSMSGWYPAKQAAALSIAEGLEYE